MTYAPGWHRPAFPYKVRTCSPPVKFFPKRGVALEHGGFPAKAARLRTLAALGSPLLVPALLAATRLACGLAWWHELWYSLSVT